MKVDTTIDPNEANRLINDLNGIAAAADAALTDDELATIGDTIDFLEEAAGIQHGEQIMESPTTGETYRVTKWIEAGDGQVVALQKEEASG